MNKTCSILVATLGGALAVNGGVTALTPVDLELSLVVDVSGSVNQSEFDLQMIGYADAFGDPQFAQAVQGGTLGQIAVNMVFYASSAAEGSGLGWTLLNDTISIDAFANALRNFGNKPFGGGTSINTGIDLAASSIGGNNYDGTRKVIDVSGDGASGAAITSTARDNALNSGVNTINGLPILFDDPTLDVFYQDNVIGGDNAFNVAVDNFADFKPEVLKKLIAEITGTVPIGDAPILAAIRTAQLLAAQNSYQDINSRLMRARAGFRGPEPVAVPSEVWNDKGAKGGMPKSVIEETYVTKPWEAFGSIGFSTSDIDSQRIGRAQRLPGYDVDLWTGTVGIEYDIDNMWSVGGALIARDGDIDVDGGGDIDTDGYGVALYGSYYRRDAFTMGNRTAHLYADLLYGYSEDDYDSSRPTGGGKAKGSTDAHTHRIEFNTGLNFEDGAFIHGPYAQIAYVDGEVDGYSESGPGAVSYPNADIESFRTQLGYQASYRLQSANGFVIPHLRLGWEHEFEDDEVIVSGLNLGEPDSDMAVVGAGVLWQFSEAVYSTVGYEGRFGDDLETHSLMLRVGVQF